MDVAALRDRIQSTLDANADIRRQAELDLKYVRIICLPTLADRLLMPFWGFSRPKPNPALSMRCWIFCRPNRSMPFNYRVGWLRRDPDFFLFFFLFWIAYSGTPDFSLIAQ